MQPEKLIIFDTTLRDGEQCPGASLNIKEKLEIARQLALLKVDVIEAGFPVASPGDFESVKQIAEEIRGSKIAGLSRALEKDIEATARALEKAESPRIHIFLSTSKLHREHMVEKAKEEIVEMGVKAIQYLAPQTFRYGGAAHRRNESHIPIGRDKRRRRCQETVTLI